MILPSLSLMATGEVENNNKSSNHDEGSTLAQNPGESSFNDNGKCLSSNIHHDTFAKCPLSRFR
jgi:hypothetical protein